MDTKEFLSQGFMIKRIIEARKTRIAELRDMQSSLPGGFSKVKVQSGPILDRIGDVTAKLLDLIAEYENDVIRLTDIEKEIIRVIDSVGRDDYRLILFERYVNLKSWEAIAEDNCYSVSGINKIHKLAINKLDTMNEEKLKAPAPLGAV